MARSQALCRSLLAEVGGNAQLSQVIYFSALATYREAADPGLTARHLAYIECLRSTGVEVELGRFKIKRGNCPLCQRLVTRHEEKETDVAIGVKLLELFWRDECDSAVLVTGDSDLAPAIRMARHHFPARGIYCCFPFKRISFELKSLARRGFRIKSRRYALHQLPDPVFVAGGKQISKPPYW